MKQLQKLANAQRGHKYGLYGVSVAFAFIIILQAYFIVSIVDQIFLQQQTFHQIIWPLGALLVVLILRAIMMNIHGRIGVKMASVVKLNFRKQLLSSYAKDSLLSSYQGQSGQKISVLMDAVDEIDGYFSQYVPQKIIATVVPLIILIVIFSLHFYSGLIIVLTAPFIPVFMAIIGRFTQTKSEEQLEQMKSFSAQFLDTLQGIVSLKLYGKSKEQRQNIHNSSISFRDSTMKVLKIAFTSSLMLEFISMLSTGLVALELGLRLVVYEQVGFFTAFFVLLLVPEFYTSLKDLGAAFHAGRGSMGAAEKIEEQLRAVDTSITWGDDKLSRLPPIIDLKDISFQYGQDGFQVKGIDAMLEPQRQTAIVGKSGSGKTTLLHLIAGLLKADSGEVRMNGYPLQQYAEQEWFQQISYISQHPYLFSGTIKENIVVGLSREVSDGELMDAVVKAGIAGMIQQLPQGFHTPIGEGGRGLSGGEKQRIALARAFLKQPMIVLFDEPTTGLDLYTEQILQQSIDELSEQSTVVIVAHRLQTIKRAHQIWFMSEGELIAQGTHDELLRTNPDYQELFIISKEVVGS